MTPRSPLAAIAAIVLLAGCAAPSADPAPSIEPAGISITDDRPDTSFGAIATGPAVGPDVNATTADPPRLVPGEWWRIRFTSTFFEGSPDFLRVVAAVEPEGYLFGMPHEGWFKEAIAYHAPAFGDIGLDLSYELHNVRFEPLRFPLDEGATWETEFGGSRVTAVVESADEHTATVRFDPPPSGGDPGTLVMGALLPFDATTMRLTYDARQHEVVRFESMIGTWEVVEHGYGYEGWVTIPRGLHTAIDYGQFLPATPGGPLLTRTLDVQGGYNRLTLMHGIYALGPGLYRVRDLAPDGSEYVTELVGGDAGFTVGFHEATSPDGTWTAEDLVAGPGGTYTMGMAYHQYDIHLPDGARRSDHAHPVVR